MTIAKKKIARVRADGISPAVRINRPLALIGGYQSESNFVTVSIFFLEKQEVEIRKPKCLCGQIKLAFPLSVGDGQRTLDTKLGNSMVSSAFGKKYTRLSFSKTLTSVCFSKFNENTSY